MRNENNRHTIFVECNADQDFLMNLGMVRKVIKHHENKYQLIKALEKSTNKIALIDADPQSHPETILNQYKLESDNEGIKCYSHKKSGNKIILIYPQLEGWIINESKKCKLDITSLGLPNKYSELHNKLHKSPDKHRKLIEALIQKKSKGVVRIKSLFNLA